MTAFSTVSDLQNQMNQLASSLAMKDSQIAAYQNQLYSQYAQAQQASGYAYPGSVGSAGSMSPSLSTLDELTIDKILKGNETPLESQSLKGLLEDLL